MDERAMIECRMAPDLLDHYARYRDGLISLNEYFTLVGMTYLAAASGKYRE